MYCDFCGFSRNRLDEIETTISLCCIVDDTIASLYVWVEYEANGKGPQTPKIVE